MAKTDNRRTTVRRIEKPLQRLNSLFNEYIENLGSPNLKRERELERISNEIDDVIYDDIKEFTKYTGDDISVFLVKLFNEQDRENSLRNNPKSMEEIFSDESGSGIFSFFYERYKNQNLLYEDLNIICNQLFELKEALNTTRDAIVSADDLSSYVSCSLTFKNQETGNEDKLGLRDTVENIQKKFQLLQKLKDHIIPNTLQYGKYYVYTIPYSKLYQQYTEKKQRSEQRIKYTLEAVTDEFVKSFREESDLKNVNLADLKKTFNNVLENIEVVNDDIPLPLVLEGANDLDTLFGTDSPFRKMADKISKDSIKKNESSASMYADGTKELKDSEKDFSMFNDCYIKLIDPRRMIPIKILDHTIGYYYVHQVATEVSRTPFSQTIRANFTFGTPKDLETNFLSKITDKIVKAFNKKFLEENHKFKELILNSLIYNDIYKKDLRFQFIPVDYVTEFHVNRNEEGEGQSIIMPSLFYAKLYLALLIFKMVTIISRSNDTRVYYVRSSGIDANIANKIQEIARSIRERQINFMDLLNYNSMISKIGHAKDIFMPIGRSGERGIDFDILSGQDVQLNTELMELLRTAYINSTGVPSVIMEYINQADYARTLVMANAKFLRRVISYQMDFNNCTTELYKKILRFTSSTIDDDIIESFEFKLMPPKSLNNTNMSDIVSNADVVINMLIKAMTGEQSEQTEFDNKLKDILYRNLAKEVLPMLPWNRAEEIFRDAFVEATSLTENKKNRPESDNSGQ